MIAWVALLQLTISVAGPATSPEYLPLHVAQAEGLFAREGAGVTLHVTRADAPAAEALAEGRVQLAATSLDAALGLGHRDGAPPRPIFGLTAAPPVALLAPAGRPDVKGPRDLAGKTVGIPGPGSPEHLALLSLLSRERVPVGKVTIASFGERRLVNALASGAAAAVVMGDPWATRLVDDGRAVALADLRQPAGRERWLGSESVSAAVFLRADETLGVAELAPLARALLAAVERVRTAPPEALAAVLPAAVIGQPDDFAVRLAGARRIYVEQGRISPAMLEAGVDLARERFPIPQKVKLPKLSRWLFIEPLEAALGRPPR